MYLTIRDVLHLFQNHSVKLVAGSGGLENSVSNVNIMDAPDIWNWVKPGDLILTTGYAVKDDPLLQEQLVCELAAAGCAGIGIKTKRFLPDIPENVRLAADKHKLPVLELPLTMSLAEIMNPVISTIAARQSYLLHRSNEIHKTLTKEAIHGGGLNSIIACLGRLTQCPVGCYDINGRPLSHWLPENLPGAKAGTLSHLEAIVGSATGYNESLQKALAQTKGPHTSTLVIDGHDFTVSAFAIMSSNEFFGHIVIIQPNGVFQEINSIALEHACTVAALDFLKQKAVSESRRLHSRDLLEHILFGDIGNQITADLIAASKLANSRYFQCLVVAVDDTENVNIPVVMTLLYKTIHQAVAALYPLSLVSELAGKLVVLLASGTSFETELLYEKLTAALEETHKRTSVSIGLGSTSTSVETVRRSYKDALTCLDLGRLTKGPGKITNLSEIASYYILANSADAGVLDQVCGSAIAKLEKADDNHHSELLKTLEKYLECDKNLTQTAAELFIHRNTLANRLEKITDITGFALDHHEQAFNLRLALRLKKLAKLNRMETKRTNR